MFDRNQNPADDPCSTMNMSYSFQDIGLILATIRVHEVSYKTKVNPRWLGQPPPYTESAKIDVGQISPKKKSEKMTKSHQNFFFVFSVSQCSLQVREVPKINFRSKYNVIRPGPAARALAKQAAGCPVHGHLGFSLVCVITSHIELGSVSRIAILTNVPGIATFNQSNAMF